MTQTYQRSTVVPAVAKLRRRNLSRRVGETSIGRADSWPACWSPPAGREQAAPQRVPTAKPDAAAETQDPRESGVRQGVCQSAAGARGGIQPVAEVGPVRAERSLMLESVAPRMGTSRSLLKLDDSAALADELVSERSDAQADRRRKGRGGEYLAKNADRRPAAVNNLAWALLACTEFCVNH